MDIYSELQWYIDQGFGNPFELTPVTDRKLIINACLTGIVPQKKDTPHVPISAQEIINDIIECYQLGATMFHLHARDEEGAPTYKTEVFEEVIPHVRSKCPDIIIITTTSGRIHNTFECRSLCLDLEGDARPDMGSLTMGSMNFPKQASINNPNMIRSLASKMLEKGIMPELEIFEPGMINTVRYFQKKEIIQEPLYFNLLLGSLGTMAARIKDLDYLIEDLPSNCTWAATGIGSFQLPINVLAILKGGHVRVGLEDHIWYDYERTRLASNADLVKRLVDFAKSIGREIATPQEAREMIGIKSTQQIHV